MTIVFQHISPATKQDSGRDLSKQWQLQSDATDSIARLWQRHLYTPQNAIHVDFILIYVCYVIVFLSCVLYCNVFLCVHAYISLFTNKKLTN